MVPRIVLVLLVCAGCGIVVSCSTDTKNVAAKNKAVAEDDLIEVWVKRGNDASKDAPPKSLAAPPGFKVTPWEAYRAVEESPWRLSLKHIWACYRDNTHYYIYDTYLNAPSAKNARRLGVKVNGMTGALDE